MYLILLVSLVCTVSEYHIKCWICWDWRLLRLLIKSLYVDCAHSSHLYGFKKEIFALPHSSAEEITGWFQMSRVSCNQTDLRNDSMVSWIYRKRMLKAGLTPFGLGHRRARRGTKWFCVGENVPNELMGKLPAVLFNLIEARFSIIKIFYLQKSTTTPQGS